MLIGIDGNEANVEKKVGISEYSFQILKNLHDLRKSGKTSHSFKIYLKQNPNADLPKEESWWQYVVVGPRKFWTQIALPLKLLIEKNKPDVFFTTTHYGPRFATMPVVISIMDLSFIRFPETFKKRDLIQLTRWTKSSALKARKIITISNSSKNDIINEYKIKKEKIEVVHLGLKDAFEKTTKNMNSLKEFGVKEDFILFVGTLQPRKNISRLIEAFAQVEKNYKKGLQLVVIGKKGWLYEEILKAPEKFNVTDKILFLDFVGDEDLPLFYKNALCYVLPSLYEGFGLPVLEAMRYGCPVITSNVSSLPEAGGDAALYFDPEDVNDIAKTIEKVINDTKLQSQMREKGLSHYKQFTWEKSAKKVLAILESI